MSGLSFSSVLGASKRQKKLRHVRLPSETTLTPRILAEALLKLCSADIQGVVDRLIDELDTRGGDPDLEPETDEAECEHEWDSLALVDTRELSPKVLRAF